MITIFYKTFDVLFFLSTYAFRLLTLKRKKHEKVCLQSVRLRL